MMILSVLIPTIPERRISFNELYDHLSVQRNRLKARNDIEIVALLDDRQRSIGRKRNDLKRLAQGEYIVFVDDDDAVASNYLEEIVCALYYKPDVVTFDSLVTINGGTPKRCIFDMRYEKDSNTATHYERLANHLCPVRAVLAPDYPDISFGEDSHYAMALKPRLNNGIRINKTLYFYRYNSITSRSFRKH